MSLTQIEKNALVSMSNDMALKILVRLAGEFKVPDLDITDAVLQQTGQNEFDLMNIMKRLKSLTASDAGFDFEFRPYAIDAKLTQHAANAMNAVNTLLRKYSQARKAMQSDLAVIFTHDRARFHRYDND